MRDQVAELAERGQGLSPEDRSRLVDMLLASLHEAPIAEVEAAGTKRLNTGSPLTIRAKCWPLTAKKFWRRPAASPGNDLSFPAACGS